MGWVATITIGLAAALVLGVVARRLGLSPIVGYLLAGVAVGPNTPGFVANAELAKQLAEVGVILLMFGVGLEFSLKDLLAVRRIAFPGALLAGGAVVAGAAVVGKALGLEPGPAIVFGLCLTSSSTIVIARGLIELNLLSSAAGRLAIGWSVVEDLVVILLLVLLPALAAGGSDTAWIPIGFTLGKVALLALVVFGIGPWLVPPLLGLVARVHSRELFTLAVLVIALGVATLAHGVFGVSIALGALLGGMVVGQSDLSHQAAADALPLRDAFAVLYFVAVGMLFDPRFVIEHPWVVVATLAIVLVVKPAVVIAVLLFRGYPVRSSLAVGAGLAQVSEFAFVLAGTAVDLGTLPSEARYLVVSAVLLSITASPLCFRGIGPIDHWLSRRRSVARFVARRAGKLAKLPAQTGEALREHAVLVGYGRVGSVLGGLLLERGFPFVVVDQDRPLIEELRSQGIPALYGDASSVMLLDRARIATARVLLVTAPDALTARLAVEHAHRVNPGIHVVARVHLESVREHLHRFPHTIGVHGELELAYAMARMMLQEFGLSAMEAEATVIDARRTQGLPGTRKTRIAEIRVPPSSAAVGRRIAELGLPRGVLVVTIGRGGEFVVPSGQTELQAEDALLVLAEPDAAREIERIVAAEAQPAS